MSENTTTDRGVSALHARWFDGFVLSSTRVPSTDGVPGVTVSEIGNGEGEELSMAAGVPALGSGWEIRRRTTQGSRHDHHAGVDA
jgi:hypothetical protein